MRKATLPLLVLLFLPLFAIADSGVWGERGISRRFAISGQRLYAADGRGVSVYDVSRSSDIRRIDIARSDDETRDLAFIGTNGLAVGTQRGVIRYEIAPDGKLTRAGSYSGLQNVSRVAASSRYVAAASGNFVAILQPSFDGFAIVQMLQLPREVRAIAFVDELLYVSVAEVATFVHDPLTGAQLDFVLVDAVDFSLSGTMLWAVGNSGLAAIDVSEPRAPHVAGRAGVGEYKLTSVAAAGPRVYAIQQREQFTGVFDGNGIGPEKQDVVLAFDASDPASPRVMSTITDWIGVVAASGTRLFLSGTHIDDEAMPYETGIPVRVYDASNLSAPQIAGEFHDLAGAVSGAWTDGSIAIVVDPPYLRVLDVSKTAQPRELSSLLIPRIQDHIRVRDGKAILYGRSDVNILDVSDPYNLRLLGTYDAKGHPPSAAAFLRDTFVEANEYSGLHIVDYSNPAQPTQIAGRIWHYHDVAAGDDVVYTFQLGNFLVLDLTNPRKVVDAQLGNVSGYQQMETIPPNSGSPQYMIWRGPSSVVMLSLADRFAPVEIATIPMQNPSIVGASETSAYVGTSEGTLARIDPADPGTLIDTDMRVTAPMQIAARGEKVVVADRYSVRVYGPDTASPPPPPPPPPPPAPAKRRASRH